MDKNRYETILSALEDIFYKEGFIDRKRIEEVAAKNGLSYQELMEAARIIGLSRKVKDLAD
jgi:NADH:ubiquinone oxidoreductase subunit E